MQTASPVSDVAIGNWTTTPLYSDIDESTASDTDYVSSETTPGEDSFTVDLGEILPPRPERTP